MKPRANFLCKNCGVLKGEMPVKHEDLPVDSVRCPYCGKKRGFVRLFDALGGVMKSKTRNLDKVMNVALDPLYAKHSKIQDGAKAFEKAANEAVDRSIHEAPASDRAKASPFKPHILPAAQVFGSLPSAARQDSRELIYPALTNRTVRPDWQK